MRAGTGVGLGMLAPITTTLAGAPPLLTAFVLVLAVGVLIVNGVFPQESQHRLEWWRDRRSHRERRWRHRRQRRAHRAQATPLPPQVPRAPDRAQAVSSRSDDPYVPPGPDG